MASFRYTGCLINLCKKKEKKHIPASCLWIHRHVLWKRLSFTGEKKCFTPDHEGQKSCFKILSRRQCSLYMNLTCIFVTHIWAVPFITKFLSKKKHLFFWTLYGHKLYSTPSHHALWLVKIHSRCPWLLLLVLTWFISLLWSRHLPFRCVLPWATLMDNQVSFCHNTFSSCFWAFYLLMHLSLIHDVCSILHQHPVMDFHRKCINAHCSSIVKSLSGAFICLTSLLPATWLNNEIQLAIHYLYIPPSCF